MIVYKHTPDSTFVAGDTESVWFAIQEISP